jgi:hypothetical protein
MRPSDDAEIPDPDAGFDDDPEEDPGEELEAMIEHADHAFASESFGVTVEEQREGESFDQRMAEERPDKPHVDVAFAIEDADGPDDEAEMLGEVSLQHDPFAAPEEAAMTVRADAPGAVDHADDLTELYDESLGQD